MRITAPRRVKRYLKGAPEYVAAIYDNGGKSADRYTVIYTAPLWDKQYAEHWRRQGETRFAPARAMSTAPYSPQGIGLFVDAMRGRHLGKLIHWSELPAECQRCVVADDPAKV